MIRPLTISATGVVIVASAIGLNYMLWEEEVEKGATLRTLFKRLTDRYPKFRELVYDPGNGELTGLVSVIFNNRVLELAGGLDAEIQDGDSVVLLPAYAGGS